ncbi:hypothetical protein MLGJGCBP_03631 [Rhodococcus sp. T7]|nr:hypothetical protein MLGJGCBP_03631 [Rhodococcus sp. T7]
MRKGDHHGTHAVDMEGLDSVRTRERAGQGLFGNRRSRHQISPGPCQGRRSDQIQPRVLRMRQRRPICRYRQGLRLRRRRPGGVDRRRFRQVTRRRETRDSRSAVRADRTDRSHSVREELLPRTGFQLPEGLCPSRDGPRKQRPDRPRSLHAPSAHQTGRDALSGRSAGDPDTAVAGRGTRGRVPVTRRRREAEGEGTRDGRDSRRQHGRRLRPHRIHRRLPGAVA